MNFPSIKMMAVVAALLVFSTGCSFYASVGFSSQAPEGTDRIAENVTQQTETKDNTSAEDVRTTASLASTAARVAE